MGAQTGCFTLLAKYFPHSHWYAFEPLEEACNNLKSNLKLNDIQNVSVYQLAVSHNSEWAVLKVPILFWEGGLATLGSNVNRFVPNEERTVPCLDLDSFAQMHGIQKVHFIKIDTEGWELFVLLGAENIIKRDHPIILMEFNAVNMQQCHVNQSQIEAFLSRLGYQWGLISAEDILCIPTAFAPTLEEQQQTMLQ